MINRMTYYAFIKHTSKRLSEMASVTSDAAEKIFLNKWQELTSFHTHLFDEVLKALQLQNHGYVRELVDQYHQFRTELKLFPGTENLLQRLISHYQLFIITDGNLEMQQEKVQGIEDCGLLFHHYLYRTIRL